MLKYALITGASSGIGKATAEKLAEDGYSLILCARRIELLGQLVAELKKKHPQAELHAFQVDVSSSDSIQNFAKNQMSLLKKVEVLVNNAGLAKGSDKLQDANPDHWKMMLDTNVMGLLLMTKALLPFLVEKKSGHIVNLGSVAGRWTYPGGAVYCASKAAVIAITEGLRLDLLGKNIRVSNIEPGMVETEFSKVRFESEDKAKAVYTGMKPLSAADIAETIAWVLARPSHVNIQELVIYPTAQASVRDVHRE